MLSLFTEDPWPLVYALGAVAVACLVALKVTQQGKYLVWALGAVAASLLLVGLDALIETDRERLEGVLHELANAAAKSDADAVLGLLTDDVSLTQGGHTIGDGQAVDLARRTKGAAARLLTKINPTRMLIRATLEGTKFDFVRVTRVESEIGSISRQGRARFRVYASGSIAGPSAQYNFATDGSGSDWEIGAREVAPGVWKIHRVTALRVPGGRLPMINSPGL